MKPQEQRSLGSILRSVHELHREEVFLWHDSLEAVHVITPGDDLDWLVLFGALAGMESMVCIAGADPRAVVEDFGCFQSTLIEGPECPWTRVFAEIVPLDAVPQNQRGLLSKAGIAMRRESLVPHLVTVPGAAAGAPKVKGRVLRGLEAAMAALATAMLDDRFVPRGIGYGGDLLEVQTDGDRRNPQVDMHWRSLVFEPGAGELQLPFTPEMLEDLMGDLQGLPSLPGQRSVGVYLAHGAPGTPARPVMLGADLVAEIPWLVTPLPQRSLFVAVVALLDFLCTGMHSEGLEPGLPEELVIASAELTEAIAPLLEPLGVSCVYHPSRCELEDLMRILFGATDPGLASDGSTGIPARDDLDAWKELDAAIGGRIQEYLSYTGVNPAQYVMRYFGSDTDAVVVTESHHRENAWEALQTYALVEHRDLPGTATLADRMFAGPLPLHERILIGARALSRPEFFRVVACDPGATVTVESYLTRDTTLLQERTLSECVEVGHMLVLRLLRVGDFVFPQIAGPPVRPFEVEDALDYMEETREAEDGYLGDEGDLNESAHLFGLLWSWSLDRPEFSPRMTNTDGDDLVFHTAAFAVDDTDALERVLQGRSDVDRDPGESEYVWLADDADDPAILGQTRLGRLQVLPGEAVVEVNSAARFERIREWLEEIPGVTFTSVQVKPLEDMMSDGDAGIPLDDRLNPPPPIALTPEATAQLQSTMDAYTTAWLDMEIPALGGRTPREAAAADEAGRKQVIKLIRTMRPPLLGGVTEQPDLPDPRDRLLRELGLD